MYEIWISPASDVEYFYVQSCDTRSEADNLTVEWQQSGYFTTVRNKRFVS